MCTKNSQNCSAMYKQCWIIRINLSLHRFLHKLCTRVKSYKNYKILLLLHIYVYDIVVWCLKYQKKRPNS